MAHVEMTLHVTVMMGTAASSARQQGVQQGALDMENVQMATVSVLLDIGDWIVQSLPVQLVATNVAAACLIGLMALLVTAKKASLVHSVRTRNAQKVAQGTEHALKVNVLARTIMLERHVKSTLSLVAYLTVQATANVKRASVSAPRGGRVPAALSGQAGAVHQQLTAPPAGAVAALISHANAQIVARGTVVVAKAFAIVILASMDAHAPDRRVATFQVTQDHRQTSALVVAVVLMDNVCVSLDTREMNVENALATPKAQT